MCAVLQRAHLCPVINVNHGTRKYLTYEANTQVCLVNWGLLHVEAPTCEHQVNVSSAPSSGCFGFNWTLSHRQSAGLILGISQLVHIKHPRLFLMYSYYSAHWNTQTEHRSSQTQYKTIASRYWDAGCSFQEGACPVPFSLPRYPCLCISSLQNKCWTLFSLLTFSSKSENPFQIFFSGSKSMYYCRSFL